MRLITFAAVTVAFIASVSAKIGFGSCPETVPMKTWTDYSDAATGFGNTQFYYHEVIAIDNQFEQLLGLAKKFNLKLPLNVGCDDLGTVPPFSQIAKAIFDAAEA